MGSSCEQAKAGRPCGRPASSSEEWRSLLLVGLHRGKLVDVMAQEGSVLAHDHHRDCVESDRDVTALGVLREPLGCEGLALDAVVVLLGEAVGGVFGLDGDEDDGVLVHRDDVDGAEAVGCLPAGGEDFVAPALQEPLGSGDCLLVQIAHNVTS